MSDNKWSKPQDIDRITAVFPASVQGKLLPVRPDVPDEFRSQWHSRSHPWCGPVNDWFSNGLDTSRFVAKEGIDAEKAWRHLGACMRSFEPKHEDKIAGVAWLMSLWFGPAQQEPTP